MRTYTSTQVVTITTIANVTRIDDNYNIIEVNYTNTTDSYAHDGIKRPRSTRTPSTNGTTGIISNKALNSFVNGGVLKIDHNMHLLSQHSLDIFNKTFFMDAWEQWKKRGESEDDNILVRFDTNSHMLFDTNDDPIPLAMHFDYIDAQMSNGKYDLEAVLEHLLKNDRITFTDEPKVLDVPYYNNESGCRKFLDFMWSPTQEDYIKLWEWCKEKGGKYPSTSRHYAVRMLDLLDIEQFRKPDNDYT